MIDRFGREIDYMRISVTDRCNLRCVYCMPKGIGMLKHQEILTYEEILELCTAAVSLGIKKFKITGGEPLARKGCIDFIRALKSVSGVEQVTLTTNGVLLEEYLPELKEIGIDGINISIDTLKAAVYGELTGGESGCIVRVIKSLTKGADLGLKVKVNSVLLERTKNEISGLLGIAEEMPIDVRFIELMPIGEGRHLKGIPMADALKVVREIYPDIKPTNEKRGNGPAAYYKSSRLKGRVGFIHAVSKEFCDKCNRVRLTGTGMLKPCLCYEEGVDLKSILRSGDMTQLITVMEGGIFNKPRAHSFNEAVNITENRTMNQIGG